MTPIASPRHPWKALGVLIAAFALVHGVGAHSNWHDHDGGHVHIVDSVGDVPDVDDADPVDIVDDDGAPCDAIDVRIQDGTIRIDRHGAGTHHDDAAPAVDVFDGVELS